MDVVKADPSPAQAAAAPAASSAPVLYEQALTLSAMGFYKEAMKTLREVCIRAPEHGPAWQKLAELLRMDGKDSEAAKASARAAPLCSQWSAAKDERTAAEIEAAEQAWVERLDELGAEKEQCRALRNHLREHPTDAAALRLLGRHEGNNGNIFARRLFRRAVDLNPGYDGARVDLVRELQDHARHARELEETRRLLERDRSNPQYRMMHADALRAVGDMEAAIRVLEDLVEEHPSVARLRCMYARVLRFAGRKEASARECRKALELKPGMGVAYAGLAKLRGNFLTDDDVQAMHEHLRREVVDDDEDEASRKQMQYALGQALEQRGDFAGSFAAYEAANQLAKDPDYDLEKDIRNMRRRRLVFTARAVDKSAALKKNLPTPIFVVGMPRAGSTLVEQILASHSQVEGTLELPALPIVVERLSYGRLMVAREDFYPECTIDLTPEQLAELGESYVRETAAYRRTNRPFFVDKRPWNWLEAGLIRMILPHAKVVDVRREPMAACFGMFKQNLGSAQFTNDFNHLARYYTEYVKTMDHFGKAMPGHIHSICYEQLVENTDAEIRRLLDFCGLPFEQGCLRFWETSRAVATPSAEQVRRPINREGLDQWRKFESWLGPLKEALEAASADTVEPEPQGYELALTFAAMAAYPHAIKELQAVVKRAPFHSGAWRKLSELLRLAGKDKAAQKAEERAARSAAEAPKWRPSQDARMPEQLDAGKLSLERSLPRVGRAAQMAKLREHLAQNPTDAAAVALLAGLETRDGDQITAVALLSRALELAPSWRSIRLELVSMLLDAREFEQALDQIAILVRDAPANPSYRAIRANVMEATGHNAEAIAIMEELVREHPRNARFWLRYGILLRTAGKRDEAARALRTCLEIVPKMGDAYAALADLKRDYLGDADVHAMRAQLADPSLEPFHRMRIHYALGAVLERMGDFGASFASYQAAARLIRGSFLSRGEAYNEKVEVERVRNHKRFFTSDVLSCSPTPVSPSPDVTPIFVVGMPRAGSTLVEQILGSHSKVEATRELPVMGKLVRELILGRRMSDRHAYPDCLQDMTAPQLAALGEKYIQDARAHRQTDQPFFVDKRPWNWLEAGLIHMILPQAKIIDIRREPMAACFAMYKQQLPRDAAFSYDLRDLGRYYNLYVSLMEHWESVMPGRIHFVQYERLVQDTENEIRRMLDYCRLPFEENCLRFWESDRAVLTPSAEQVRRPIYRDAVEQWRNFEPWLEPLKAALAQPLASVE